MRAIATTLTSTFVLTCVTAAMAQSSGAPAAPTAPAPPATPQIRPTPPAPPAITLAPGDRAPELKPEEWVKGARVDGFEPGKVYVVEFWATWCGPCIAAIPHLTELQKENPDAVFIGLAGSERTPKGAEGDERLSKVRDFVSGKGDVMGYRVAFTPERKISTEWMTAAGQNGIPCTFLVGKDGSIEWIGHPMGLDEPLSRVVAGTWDREAEATRAKDAAAARRKNAEALRALSEARAAKDWDKALSIFDQLIIELPKNPQAHMDRYQLLAGVANKPEIAAANRTALLELINDSPAALNQIAWFIVDDSTVQTRDLDFALRCSERANELAESNDPAILDTLARVWWEKGDRAKAVEFQQRAVRELGSDETKMAKEIREALERYKSAPAAK